MIFFLLEARVQLCCSVQCLDGRDELHYRELHHRVGCELFVQLWSRVLEGFPLPVSAGLRQPQLLGEGHSTVSQRGDAGQQPWGTPQLFPPAIFERIFFRNGWTAIFGNYTARKRKLISKTSTMFSVESDQYIRLSHAYKDCAQRNSLQITFWLLL